MKQFTILLITALGLIAQAVAQPVGVDQAEAARIINNVGNRFKVNVITPSQTFLQKSKSFTGKLDNVTYFQGPGNLIGIAGVMRQSKAGFVGYMDPDARWLVGGTAFDLENSFELTRAAAMQLLPNTKLGLSAQRDVSKVKEHVAAKAGITTYGVTIQPTDLVLLQSVDQNSHSGNRQVWLIADLSDPHSKAIFKKVATKAITVHWVPAGKSSAAKTVGASMLGAKVPLTALNEYMTQNKLEESGRDVPSGTVRYQQNEALLRKANIKSLPVFVEIIGGKAVTTGGRDAILAKFN